MLSIQLHAQNLEKNINRFYSLRVTKNLFGAWTITIQYTQLRTRGPSKLFFCDTVEEAKERVYLILSRRLNYNRRMGCNYRIVHIDAEPSVILEEWIPDLHTIQNDTHTQ